MLNENANFGLLRMRRRPNFGCIIHYQSADASPLPHQPLPGRRRGEYATESAGRNTPVLRRLHHLLNG